MSRRRPASLLGMRFGFLFSGFLRTGRALLVTVAFALASWGLPAAGGLPDSSRLPDSRGDPPVFWRMPTDELEWRGTADNPPPKALVANVQVLLSSQGYRPGNRAGRMDDATRSAIARFWRDEGRPSEGRIDRALVDALRQRVDLVLAAQSGQVDSLRRLLSEGVAVESRDLDGWSALMVASFSGQTSTAHLLLSHGADVNFSSSSGHAPLHAAALGGHAEVVRLLAEHGAHLDAHTRAGHTPRDLAVAEGHRDIEQVLLTLGSQAAATSVPDQRGTSKRLDRFPECTWPEEFQRVHSDASRAKARDAFEWHRQFADSRPSPELLGLVRRSYERRVGFVRAQASDESDYILLVKGLVRLDACLLGERLP